jgi:hypothetical protein
MLQRAYTATPLDGVKLDLLNLAIKSHNDISDSGHEETGLHAAMKDLLLLALNSGNRYLVEVSADELGREDAPYTEVLELEYLKKIVQNRALGKDARRSIMALMRSRDLPDVDWIDLTSDSSISVARRAIYNLYNEDYWYPIALNRVATETEPALILAWGQKLHFAERNKGADALKLVSQNRAMDISTFQAMISELLIYRTDYTVIEELSYSLIENNNRYLLSAMPAPLKERIAMLRRVLSNNADWDAEEKEKNETQLLHYEALLKQVEEVLEKL